jgi:hypothetical protein
MVEGTAMDGKLIMQPGIREVVLPLMGGEVAVGGKLAGKMMVTVLQRSIKEKVALPLQSLKNTLPPLLIFEFTAHTRAWDLREKRPPRRLR